MPRLEVALFRARCRVKQTMIEKPDQENVSRRKALKIIVGSAGAAVSLPVLGGAAPRSHAPLCHLTPAAHAAAAHTPKFFTAQQIETLEALTETIIPADEHSPGAKAGRVWEYIDEIVAGSDQSTKGLWTQGLAALDKLASLDQGKNFSQCAPEQQIALLDLISKSEEKPTTPEERFFVAAKKATIDGYYTSAIGIHQDLEYQGNTALADFPGCTHREHKAGGDEKA